LLNYCNYKKIKQNIEKPVGDPSICKSKDLDVIIKNCIHIIKDSPYEIWWDSLVFLLHIKDIHKNKLHRDQVHRIIYQQGYWNKQSFDIPITTKSPSYKICILPLTTRYTSCVEKLATICYHYWDEIQLMYWGFQLINIHTHEGEIRLWCRNSSNKYPHVVFPDVNLHQISTYKWANIIIDMPNTRNRFTQQVMPTPTSICYALKDLSKLPIHVYAYGWGCHIFSCLWNSINIDFKFKSIKLVEPTCFLPGALPEQNQRGTLGYVQAVHRFTQYYDSRIIPDNGDPRLNVSTIYTKNKILESYLCTFLGFKIQKIENNISKLRVL